MERQITCGFFQWYDPPSFDHMKLTFSWLKNKASVAEKERDKEKAKSNLLSWVVVMLSVVVLIYIISHKF